MTKIARVRTPEGLVCHGVVQDSDTIQIIDGNPFDEWEPTVKTLPLSDVKLLAPVSPPNIIAIGRNYRGHVKETNASLPDHPAVFLKATTALNNPGDDIVLPKAAPNEVDYECELVIIIGKTARHVCESEALDYVLGYTCGNDVSARDCQKRLDVQWARAKSFDTFAPMGPWFVTDIDPDQVAICSRLNGQVMQSSNTGDLIFSCRYLISYLSQNFTLLPGTAIMTGTPAGVGFTRRPPVFLRPGDTVEVEIEGIGVLRNTVTAER